MDLELNQHVYDILVHDFAFPEKDVNAFVVYERRYLLTEADPGLEGSLGIMNKSFASYDAMTPTEKDYLKFVMAWRVSYNLQLRNMKHGMCMSEAAMALQVEHNLKVLETMTAIMNKFKKGMRYYIPLFEAGTLDKSKFYYKILPEYIGQKLTEVKATIERDIQPQFSYGL